MLLYYITDRRQFPGSSGEQQSALLRRIGEAARAGVDYIQLREKDLTSRQLELLARQSVKIVRENSQTTRLLTSLSPAMPTAFICPTEISPPRRCARCG
jgi:thiamine-phosphate pyrophosphorylase